LLVALCIDPWATRMALVLLATFDGTINSSQSQTTLGKMFSATSPGGLMVAAAAAWSKMGMLNLWALRDPCTSLSELGKDVPGIGPSGTCLYCLQTRYFDGLRLWPASSSLEEARWVFSELESAVLWCYAPGNA